MRIAIYEPNNDGHRYTHLKRLMPALAELGKVTVVTSAEGAKSTQFEAQLRGVSHLFDLDASMPLTDPQGPAYLDHVAANLQRVARTPGVDHVLMPYADGTIQKAGWRRLTGRFGIPKGVEIEGLMMRGLFAYEASPDLKARLRARAWLTLTAAAPFSVIHHMDPIVFRAVARSAPGLARRMRLIPDPVEAFEPPPRHEARRKLGIPEDGRYIGCVGYQDTRKGIDRLIRAFLAGSRPPTDRLLLAGGHAKEIKAILAGEAEAAVREGRIVSLARYISDDELRLGVAALDVVATPYPPGSGHSGSSSIVIHAAGQSRPVLGCGEGWVGDTIRRFALGATCDVLDQAAFARAIADSLDRAGTFTLGVGGRRFVEFHRPENFVSCFTRRVRERLGRPPEPGRRDWSWVEEAAANPKA
jgi:hypothetical protein